MHASSLYNRRFFQVFAAVVLFMSGVALQFHFGQYVEFLGHGVNALGWVVGISMVGTILTRLHIGRWIDRFGCRRSWVAGAVVVTLCVGAVQFAHDLWLIGALRTVSQIASALVMTTVAVFAAQIAPPVRRAESIGIIGLAGFLGMIIGPTVGDWIFARDTSSAAPYHLFFTTAAAFSLLAAAITWLLREAPPGAAPRVAPPGGSRVQLAVIRRHWPGAILAVGVVFGMAFSLPGLYLERLAEEGGFRNIKLFFLTYAPTAITLRILFRRVPQTLGRVPTLVGGMLFMAAGQLALIGAASELHLIVPGILMGTGHCFVFPSMVDLGAERLPGEHRGTGTALILGAGDVGMLLGFIILGEIIDARGFDAALMTLAVSMTATAVLYAATRRGRWR